ncbi:hypothetical protein DXX99_02290 [Ammonifex thiophilus]|uniref:Uncharacterized protein n=1 Tax=Ammonifex thiophilus TaxID=444093 RepID=A0A3D8P8Y5_9THEO|nr:hypothetical protein DXX99_02290 [Ammonifex thiophilus]
MIKVFLSTQGVEFLFTERGWRKVKPGHHLVQLAEPYLQAWREHEDPEPVLDAVDRLLPTPFPNLEAKVRFLEALLRCVLVLVPKKCFTDHLRKALPGWPLYHPTARHTFLELEVAQLEEDFLFSVLVTLLPLWKRCRVHPDILYPLKGKKPLLGWLVEAPDIYHLASCEALLMVMQGIKVLRLCPRCLKLHHERKGLLCRKCRGEREREKKRVRTPWRRFFNLLAQDKRRGKLTEEQIDHLKKVAREKGLEEAKKERTTLILHGFPGRKNRERESRN